MTARDSAAVEDILGAGGEGNGQRHIAIMFKVDLMQGEQAAGMRV